MSRPEHMACLQSLDALSSRGRALRALRAPPGVAARPAEQVVSPEWAGREAQSTNDPGRTSCPEIDPSGPPSSDPAPAPSFPGKRTSGGGCC